LTLARAGRPYSVEVRSDGTVTFSSELNRVVEHIDSADARALIQHFDDAGVRFDEHGMYQSLMLSLATDVPVTTLTLTRGRRRLSIVVAAREQFTLADEVDRVTRARRWEHCARGSFPCSDY
jgi:hypothetical protein